MRTRLSILTLTFAAAALAQTGAPLPTPGNVTLPLDEYNHLVELANQPDKTPPGAPVAYAIQSAGMTLQVSGETAAAAIQLDGEVLGKGPVRVPLTSGMIVVDAQQKGSPLPLQQIGGIHSAVLEGPAEFSIALNAVFAVTIEAGRASFHLPAPAAGSVRLTLVIPGDHTNINLSPGLVTKRASDGARTAVEATLVPGRQTTVWWAAREVMAAATPKETRFLSDVKTLVTVSESQVTAAALASITVVQGEPTQFEFDIPAGFEVSSVSGATLESSEPRTGGLIIKVSDPAQRGHQFLIALERSVDASKLDVPFISVKGSQRETGEAALTGEGAMELASKESGGLKRMDLKEASPYLRSLAHEQLQAAFRYHRQPPETPALALEWVRFPDSGMLSAVSQQAVVTTLVTSEGRSLTEVKMTLRNHSRPFLKVALPAGSVILTATVAGEAVKPVEAPDGSRIPLFRPGLRPSGGYDVSFVFQHSGAPFAKKGGSELTLPKMDVPIAILRWEVFLPDRFKVASFGGDAIPARLLPASYAMDSEGQVLLNANDYVLRADNEMAPEFDELSSGQLGGAVVDPSGAAVPDAHITVRCLATGQQFEATSAPNGAWKVAGVPTGRVRVQVQRTGFQMATREFVYNANQPVRSNVRLQVGATNESVTVTSESATVSTGAIAQSKQIERDLKKEQKDKAAKDDTSADSGASVNVMNLQRRVAGVLPIRIDIPRAGSSFRFAKPLVVDEETKVTFTYKSK